MDDRLLAELCEAVGDPVDVFVTVTEAVPVLELIRLCDAAAEWVAVLVVVPDVLGSSMTKARLRSCSMTMSCRLCTDNRRPKSQVSLILLCMVYSIFRSS